MKKRSKHVRYYRPPIDREAVQCLGFLVNRLFLCGMGVTIRNRPFAKPVFVRLPLELFVALAFGFAAAGNASADSFNIGPVKLGMTNRQVSQVVRLENCNSHSSKQITCSARLPSSMGAQSMILTFDSHSKKLVQASLAKKGWPLLDNRVGQLFRELSIADCPVSRRGPGMGGDITDICLEAPNQVRYIRTGPTDLRKRAPYFQSVQIVVDAKLYADQTTRLIATERNKALYKVQQQKNREFEAGR